MHSKYQELIGLEDVNNNNNSVSYYSLNLSVTPPKKTPPKNRPPIRLHAQLVGDDFFRTLAERDTTDYMFNRSKFVARCVFASQPMQNCLNLFLLSLLFLRQRCSRHWLLRIGSNNFRCSQSHRTGITLQSLPFDFKRWHR